MSALIIAPPASAAFAGQLGAHLNWPVSTSQHLVFPEGNMYVKINAPLTGRDVVIVQSLWGEHQHERFFELLFLADAAKRGGARQVIAVVPYYAYAKADRDRDPGTSERAAAAARILASAPLSRLITLDLHQPAVAQLFSLPVSNLAPTSLWADYLRAHTDTHRLCVVAPDAGSRPRAHALAKMLSADCAAAHKTRPTLTGRPVITGFDGDVHARPVVIVDDFTTTGQTLLTVAQLLRQRGATRVSAAVTHTPLTAAALAALQAGPFDQLVTTNTTRSHNQGKLTVLDATPLVAAELQHLLVN